MKDQPTLEQLKQDAITNGERRAQRIQRGYEFALKHEEPVLPGEYEVIEADYGGMRDITQFVITVTEEMTMAELFLKLLDQKNYLSDWDYLKIRPYTTKPDTFIVE